MKIITGRLNKALFNLFFQIREGTVPSSSCTTTDYIKPKFEDWCHEFNIGKCAYLNARDISSIKILTSSTS